VLVSGDATGGSDRRRTALGVEQTPEGRRVVVSRRIDAPPERVAELLVDTRRWPEWGPSVVGVETHPPRIREGSTGRVETVVGVWLPFTVTRASEWAWAWRIGPVRATGHRVTPEDGSCRVGFEVPLYGVPYLPVCWVALRRIEALATAR
jgi:hypothetical protein